MSHIVGFDSFEVDLAAGQLLKRGIRIGLRDQSFQVLASLLEHPGEVVTREELCRRLWRDQVFVDFDNNLNTAVARLREALGDSAEHPRFIETLPKRGYRFLGKVSNLREAPEPAPVRTTRLLVLPFVNLSGDPAQEYFSDAMTDEIITELASLARDDLAVIARTTAMHYKGNHQDVARIGRELGVDYLVEGAVRRTENQIGINVQLIQTSDQGHLFARRYEAEPRDIFQMQSSIAHGIAAHIPSIADKVRQAQVTGAGVGGHVRRKPTEDLLAYHLYLQGRYHMYLETPEDLAQAKQYFEQAIARDPHFALAYDALGEYYWWIGFFGYVAPKEAFSAGLWAALRAIESDNTLAETHALLGQFCKGPNFDWAEVHREMTLALELNPASPLVRFRHAMSELMPLGQLEEAIAELERALELDPLGVSLHCWRSVTLWLARDYERAMEEARLYEKLDPGSYVPHFLMGHVYRDTGMLPEAVAAQRRAVELSGTAPQMLGWLGFAVAKGGNVAEARDVLQRLQAMAGQAYVPASCFAWIHLGLGETGEALTWMDCAIDQRDPMMTPIKSYPFLDPIRADPRFVALLRRMNLEP